MSPSRGLQAITPKGHICRQCRLFATTGPRPSGHNRWSKIKHDKGKTDAAKNRQRSIFAHEIATASKLFGPNLNGNPRLADLVSKAKKEGFAKASIEAAIARGQGRSLSGASLESITIEGILPHNVAVIVECETDNKLRTLSDVRLIIKGNGGSATPSSYLFGKRGRITFESRDGIGIDEALEAALEAGGTDVEQDEGGRIMVSAEPADTKAVGEAVAKALDLQIATSEILWEPNEDTKVDLVSDEAAHELGDFVDELQDKEASVQAIAMNVAQGSLSSETWKDLQSRLSN